MLHLEQRSESLNQTTRIDIAFRFETVEIDLTSEMRRQCTYHHCEIPRGWTSKSSVEGDVEVQVNACGWTRKTSAESKTTVVSKSVRVIQFCHSPSPPAYPIYQYWLLSSLYSFTMRKPERCPPSATSLNFKVVRHHWWSRGGRAFFKKVKSKTSALDLCSSALRTKSVVSCELILVNSKSNITYLTYGNGLYEYGLHSIREDETQKSHPPRKDLNSNTAAFDTHYIRSVVSWLEANHCDMDKANTYRH